ncbi:MAG: hypothetical protein MZV63_67105 [Marinilabiliales bacterium]|nr:hypothetical protein [Marinilabiliales bacterium]
MPQGMIPPWCSVTSQVSIQGRRELLDIVSCFYWFRKYYLADSRHSGSRRDLYR